MYTKIYLLLFISFFIRNDIYSEEDFSYFYRSDSESLFGEPIIQICIGSSVFEDLPRTVRLVELEIRAFEGDKSIASTNDVVEFTNHTKNIVISEVGRYRLIPERVSESYTLSSECANKEEINKIIQESGVNWPGIINNVIIQDLPHARYQLAIKLLTYRDRAGQPRDYDSVRNWLIDTFDYPYDRSVNLGFKQIESDPLGFPSVSIQITNMRVLEYLNNNEFKSLKLNIKDPASNIEKLEFNSLDEFRKYRYHPDILGEHEIAIEAIAKEINHPHREISYTGSNSFNVERGILPEFNLIFDNGVIELVSNIGHISDKILNNISLEIREYEEDGSFRTKILFFNNAQELNHFAKEDLHFNNKGLKEFILNARTWTGEYIPPLSLKVEMGLYEAEPQVEIIEFPENREHVIEVELPQADEKYLDMVFLFDGSGSMEDEIDGAISAKEHITELVRETSDNINISSVYMRGYETKRKQYRTQSPVIIDNTKTHTTGNNESIFFSLYQLIHAKKFDLNSLWREESLKTLFLFTDEYDNAFEENFNRELTWKIDSKPFNDLSFTFSINDLKHMLITNNIHMGVVTGKDRTYNPEKLHKYYSNFLNVQNKTEHTHIGVFDLSETDTIEFNTDISSFISQSIRQLERSLLLQILKKEDEFGLVKDYEVVGLNKKYLVDRDNGSINLLYGMAQQDAIESIKVKLIFNELPSNNYEAVYTIKLTTSDSKTMYEEDINIAVFGRPDVFSKTLDQENP